MLGRLDHDGLVILFSQLSFKNGQVFSDKAIFAAAMIFKPVCRIANDDNAARDDKASRGYGRGGN